MTPFITKESKKKELFDEKKVHSSLIRSGPTKKTANEILKEVKKKVVTGVKSEEIYNCAMKHLEKRTRKRPFDTLLKEPL